MKSVSNRVIIVAALLLAVAIVFSSIVYVSNLPVKANCDISDWRELPGNLTWMDGQMKMYPNKVACSFEAPAGSILSAILKEVLS